MTQLKWRGPFVQRCSDEEAREMLAYMIAKAALRKLAEKRQQKKLAIVRAPPIKRSVAERLRLKLQLSHLEKHDADIKQTTKRDTGKRHRGNDGGGTVPRSRTPHHEKY